MYSDHKFRCWSLSSRTRFLLFAICVLTYTAAAINPTQAQTLPDVDRPPQPKPLPSTEYSSFEVQGEYEGWMVVNGQKQDYALQVVGTGKDKVRSVMLIGKLPGLGTYEFQSAKLNGQKNADPKLNYQLKSEHGITLEYEEAEQKYVQRDHNQEVIAEFKKLYRVSSTEGLPPSESAQVLFDGTPHQLNGAEVDADQLLKIGSVTAFPVKAFRLHLEFKIPYQPMKSQQARGNSGVYIQRRYEVQILDSFGEPNRFNYCGSLYRQRPPALLMSFPPEQWQTYDIWFQPAQWSGKEKTANAKITVKHNGVTIHDQVEIVNKTGNGHREGPEGKPILFQNHGDPVKFRNIWIELSDQ